MTVRAGAEVNCGREDATGRGGTRAPAKRSLGTEDQWRLNMGSSTLKNTRSILVIIASAMAVIGGFSSAAIFVHENVAPRASLEMLNDKHDEQIACIYNYSLDILNQSDLRENIYARYINTRMEILAARLGGAFEGQETNLEVLNDKKQRLWRSLQDRTEKIKTAIANQLDKCKWEWDKESLDKGLFGQAH